MDTNTIANAAGATLNVLLAIWLKRRYSRQARQEDEQQQLEEAERIARFEERRDVRKLLETRLTVVESRCETLQRALFDRIQEDGVKTAKIQALDDRVKLLERELEIAHAKELLYESEFKKHNLPIPHFKRSGDIELS